MRIKKINIDEKYDLNEKNVDDHERDAASHSVLRRANNSEKQFKLGQK